MNDWTDKCSVCRYERCQAPEACMCELEREAADEVRRSMRMLGYMAVYAAGMLVIILSIYFFL